MDAATAGYDPTVQATGAPQISESVCAVVVTYNRSELLRECLTRIAGQTRPVDRLIVVDNASTDGTAKMVVDEFPEAMLVRLTENGGGAGGFHAGIERAHALGHDWLWLLDDDTFATPQALEALLEGAARASVRPMLVTSQVRWKDETLHPMNGPFPRWNDPALMADAAAVGLLELRWATYVSVAIRREAIDRYGLPLAHYFLWADDVEHTARILRHERGQLVPESVVHHWTATAHSALSEFTPRFYYHVRNSLLIVRGNSFAPLERAIYLVHTLASVLTFLRRHGRMAEARSIVARGLRDGLRDPVR